MNAKITAPSIMDDSLERQNDELRAKVAELQQQNADLVDDKLDLEDRIDNVQNELDDCRREHGRRTDDARRVIVDYHDEAGHLGSQRFCTEAPCPAINALIEERVL